MQLIGPSKPAIRGLIGFVVGCALTAVGVKSLDALTEIVWAHQYEQAFLNAASYGSLLLPAAIAVVVAVRWQAWRVAAVAALPAVLLTNCSMTVSLFGPVGFGGPPGAGSYLLWSMPQPTTPEGTKVPLSYWTADELNRVHQGSSFGKITFVDGTVPSTRPEVVSVNPIDDYTWGAAAYSWQTERCYVVLDAWDAPRGRYGHTNYGVLPDGTACAASVVDWSKVTADHWPVLPFH